MEVLEAKAMQEGCRMFMLETGPTLTDALNLYARMGYRRCGPFGDYPDDPLSVFMQKKVGQSLSAAPRTMAAPGRPGADDTCHFKSKLAQ